MPIYRAEQARLSFAGEAGPGGYIENASADDEGGGGSTVLASNTVAGAKSLVVSSATSFAVGDYIRIEAAGASAREIRKIVEISGTTFYLDAPLGFRHLAGVTVVEMDTASNLAGNSFITFLPGVYTSITTPDPENEFLPQYFLSTTGSRNFTRMYRGQQSFNGSLSSLILLNGFPLRFPIGKVATVGTDSGAGGSTLSSATAVGVREIDIAAGTGYADGDFIQIDTGNNSEVRQIISGGGTTTLVLNYPLLIAHASGVACNEVAAPFTHTIVETSELGSMSWHLQMRDSGEAAANDLLRRYFGGKVNRGTLSADEGGLLMFSWDDIQFLDLIHNQTAHSAVTGEILRSSSAMIAPAGIGGSIPEDSSALGTPTFPTTDPYYYSQGVLTFFGQELARIRDFRLEINNNIETRRYINTLGAGRRGPTEIQEQRREYRLSATLALPDSLAADASTRTLWKELILEGNYDAGLAGFDMSLAFTRGASDSITITLPSASASDGFETQGGFIVRAPHAITEESPVQAEVEILVRNLSIVIVDSIGVYP